MKKYQPRSHRTPKTFKPDPFIDLSSGCAAAGINPKTARRWWESNPAKFPKPILIQGKLYFRESWIKNWMENMEANGEKV